ncbi:hypothetical protein AVEN_195869-1 [Araneus ventricosus]|uniref:Uncharacterized protein n=1 Tax=Araneus ventricosus TaxID=182803 RepID=A0A4Y2DU87_ARAVE|nr:hypothetical protein AVEN_195869-1 [Araneus ventricosus]
MASAVDSRIFKPFLPSLLHFATVKVAVALCNDFHLVTLQHAFGNIKAGKVNVLFGNDELPLMLEIQRAQEKLRSIPGCLRKRVMEAVHGLIYVSRQWRDDQYRILRSECEDCNFYWRSDGRIDGNKTAQHFVQNANIDFRKRFALACKYCLQESIQTLWPEVEASGETDGLGMDLNYMVRFWVIRMRDGSRVPQTQDLRKFFSNLLHCLMAPRLCSFFPSVRPEKRENYFFFIKLAEDDDCLSCLYAMTEEEQKLMAKRFPLKLLNIAMEWPLRSIFVETVEKMWNYIDARCFRDLMDLFFEKESAWKDFDYYELFEVFWNSSPIHLRESVKKIPYLRAKIDFCLNEIRKGEELIFKNEEMKK